MELIVNGRPREVPSNATVGDVMEMLGHGASARGVAVALNGEVVTKAQWSATSVTEHDRVEVLGAVQGG